MHAFHPFWSQEVPCVEGQLLLTPCPGTQSTPLSQALDQLRLAGAYAVVTMMTDDELRALDLAMLGEQVQVRAMQWFHLPIDDDAAPDSQFEQAWQQTLPILNALLLQGKNLVIHCKGGSGRTGLVAASLLLHHGMPLEQAMAAIKTHRPKAFKLLTHQQWLNQLAQHLAQT